MIIDAHQHFWNYSPSTHGWIDDTMAVLKRDFHPHHLKDIYQENNIDACVAVQASQTENETQFLLDLAAQCDFIKGVVGWVDLKGKQVSERLEFYSQFKKLSGFRHIVQSEPDPNFMLHADFQRGISALQAHNYTYDILIFPKQLDAASALVRQFPNQKFVVDHLAKPFIKSGDIDDWKKGMIDLSASENVFCKLSGMVTEANWNDWEYKHFVPYLDVVMEAFGADRLMFGSDWPVCLLAASYDFMKEIITTYISKLSQSEIEQIMGLNALTFYNINH